MAVFPKHHVHSGQRRFESYLGYQFNERTKVMKKPEITLIAITLFVSMSIAFTQKESKQIAYASGRVLGSMWVENNKPTESQKKVIIPSLLVIGDMMSGVGTNLFSVDSYPRGQHVVYWLDKGESNRTVILSGCSTVLSGLDSFFSLNPSTKEEEQSMMIHVFAFLTGFRESLSLKPNKFYDDNFKYDKKFYENRVIKK